MVRKTPGGRFYLDAGWEAYRLVVEVDGIHHLGAKAVVADALRHNDIALQADIVLRIPLIGLRVAEADFIQQIRQALIAGGWALADSVAS